MAPARSTSESAPRGDVVLTRKESKAVTRRRLLDAALRILDEEGEAALTTTRVTKLAGIAQSSFYVHFTDMDDLLHNLIDELTVEWRRQTREARKTSRDTPLDAERFRDTFRVPMAHAIAHPQLFRLLLRGYLDRSSPVGAWSRSVLESNRAGLIDDLLASGFPSATDEDERRASMIADVIIAMTQTLTLGHLEGRYPDVEEIIDVLVAFSIGYFTLFRPDADAVEVIEVAAKALTRPREKQQPERARGARR